LPIVLVFSKNVAADEFAFRPLIGLIASMVDERVGPRWLLVVTVKGAMRGTLRRRGDPTVTVRKTADDSGRT
jgi:hypothetical protein